LLLLNGVRAGIALAALKAFVLRTQPGVFVIETLQLAIIDGPGRAMDDAVLG
jgi:hypothetical protein